MPRFKLIYLLPFYGAYAMWRDFNAPPVRRKRKFPRRYYAALLDSIPIYGPLRLRSQLDKLRGQIEWMNNDTRVALQVYDVKMDKLYKKALATLSEESSP
jgi:hypothetical protein